MTLRYCIPRVQGRGAGLGNELIPWARSFLAAQYLGATCLPPAFGLNTRQYWRHFGTPRLDWLHHRAMTKVLPMVTFTEADYLRHGGGDFINAFEPFADENKLHHRSVYALITDGMWGGYRHIAAARDFIFTTLYQSRFAARNLLTIQSRLDRDKITVGMHVRLGDFGSAPVNLADYQGKFNLALPLDWYRNIAMSIQEQLGDKVQFLIVSDGTAEQLSPLLNGLPAITTADISDSDCSDLLALANTDLLVCSVSSFSSTAAFLSQKPYLWFEPNLQKHPEGCYSIWGHEPSQKRQGSYTQVSIQTAPYEPSQPWRGEPVGMSGILNNEFLLSVVANKRRQDCLTDLIQYGVVPVEQASANS